MNLLITLALPTLIADTTIDLDSRIQSDLHAANTDLVNFVKQSPAHLSTLHAAAAAGDLSGNMNVALDIVGGDDILEQNEVKRTADLFAALGMPWDERRQASAKLNPRKWVEERCGAAFIAEAEAFAASYDDVTSAPHGMRHGRTLVVLPDVRTGFGDSLVGMIGNLFTYGIYLKQPIVFASQFITGVPEATRGVFDFAMQDVDGYEKGAKRAWLSPSEKCRSYQYCTSSGLPAPVVRDSTFQSNRFEFPLYRSMVGVGAIVAPSNRGTFWVWLRNSERDPALSAFLEKIGLLHHPNPFGCVLNSMVLANAHLAPHFADTVAFRELTDPDVVTIMLHIRVGTVFKAMAPSFRGPGAYGGADFALGGEGATKEHPYEELVDPAIFLPYTECARQIEAWLPKTPTQRFRWFVNSDSAPLKEKLKAAFPERVLTTSTTPRHSRGASHSLVARQLADWYQMGMADAFVLGGFSTFGRTAAFRTAGSSSILTIEWKKEKKTGNDAGNCHYTNELQVEVAAQLKAAMGGARVDRSVFARLAATCDCSHAAAHDPTHYYSAGAGL